MIGLPSANHRLFFLSRHSSPLPPPPLHAFPISRVSWRTVRYYWRKAVLIPRSCAVFPNNKLNNARYFWDFRLIFVEGRFSACILPRAVRDAVALQSVCDVIKIRAVVSNRPWLAKTPFPKENNLEFNRTFPPCAVGFGYPESRLYRLDAAVTSDIEFSVWRFNFMAKTIRFFPICNFFFVTWKQLFQNEEIIEFSQTQ